MDDYERRMRTFFPRDVQHFSITIPLKAGEQFLAYDQNQKLWAYTSQPKWSPASQKWIPQDADTPRHIFTWKGAQVNAKDSIGYFPGD